MRNKLELDSLNKRNFIEILNQINENKYKCLMLTLSIISSIALLSVLILNIYIIIKFNQLSTITTSEIILHNRDIKLKIHKSISIIYYIIFLFTKLLFFFFLVTRLNAEVNECIESNATFVISLKDTLFLLENLIFIWFFYNNIDYYLNVLAFSVLLCLSILSIILNGFVLAEYRLKKRVNWKVYIIFYLESASNLVFEVNIFMNVLFIYIYNIFLFSDSMIIILSIVYYLLFGLFALLILTYNLDFPTPLCILVLLIGLKIENNYIFTSENVAIVTSISFISFYLFYYVIKYKGMLFWYINIDNENEDVNNNVLNEDFQRRSFVFDKYHKRESLIRNIYMRKSIFG